MSSAESFKQTDLMKTALVVREGVPQGYLSNWPHPEIEDSWAFYLAAIITTANCTSSVVLALRYYYYREAFPVNMQNVTLILLSIWMLIPVTFNYTHNILFHDVPCWLSILLNLTPYAFAMLGMCSTMRMYFLYNAQYHMARGEDDNWFVKKKHLLKGVYIELALGLYVFAICGAYMFSRFLQVESYSDLQLPVWEPRCSSLSVTQVNAARPHQHIVSSSTSLYELDSIILSRR